MSSTYILRKVDEKNIYEYRRQLAQYAENKGLERFLEPISDDNIASGARYAMGNSSQSVDALRQTYEEEQFIRRTNKVVFDSDSDSEADFDDAIKQLSAKDDLFFTGCGCKLNLERVVVISSLISVVLFFVLCFAKLISSNDQNVNAGYLPLLGAVVLQFVAKLVRSGSAK